MGCPVYKSTSTPPDETSNPTPSPSSQPSVSRSVARSRISSRIRARERLRQRRRANLISRSNRTEPFLIPSEFLSSSYSPPSPPRSAPDPQYKGEQLVLVITPNTTSNRRKGTYNMSLTTYSNKLSFSIPHSILVNLSQPSRMVQPQNLGHGEDVPVDDPGFASDNESIASEDSILSDPDWISSNRELAMELLLGSSEDEFLGSLLDSESLEDFTASMEDDRDPYEENSMDFEMGEADDESEEEDSEMDETYSTRVRYPLREVDEDYD
ncbi:hypothetical protein BDZ91DRAFT_121695 [Kalaharituber pfeilii]|nr:hypothetical protein BDZ91DRAFT_121695 [Kalaharituber pfeilii]